MNIEELREGGHAPKREYVVKGQGAHPKQQAMNIEQLDGAFKPKKECEAGRTMKPVELCTPHTSTSELVQTRECVKRGKDLPAHRTQMSIESRSALQMSLVPTECERREAPVGRLCNPVPVHALTSELIQEAQDLAALHARMATEWPLPCSTPQVLTWTQIKTPVQQREKTQSKARTKCKFIDETRRVKAKVKGCATLSTSESFAARPGSFKKSNKAATKRLGADIQAKFPAKKVKPWNIGATTQAADKKCAGIVKSVHVHEQLSNWHEYVSVPA